MSVGADSPGAAERNAGAARRSVAYSASRALRATAQPRRRLMVWSMEVPRASVLTIPARARLRQGPGSAQARDASASLQRAAVRADHVDGEDVAQACVVGGRAATTSTVDRRVIPADLRAPALGDLGSASGRGIDLPAFGDLEAYEVRSDGDELLFCEQVFVRNGASSGDVLSWRWMLTFVPDQDS